MKLYNVDANRTLDKQMVEQGHVTSGYALMCRAGEEGFNTIRQRFPHKQHWLIVCGVGNNAGDGYVIARLAKQAGIEVSVISVVEPADLKNDAALAYQDWLTAGGCLTPLGQLEQMLQQSDLVIDCLLGTGIERPLAGDFLSAVSQINTTRQGHDALSVVAIDVPSGLHADSGRALGDAIIADLTISFIAPKQGLYTGQARHFCGDIVLHTLSVPDELFAQVRSSAELVSWQSIKSLYQPRPAYAHKGMLGHLLIIGGNHGMGGAVRLAAEAALRTGTGLVSVVTRSDNINPIISARPEIMAHAIKEPDDLQPLLDKATAVVIGPGLSQKSWGYKLLQAVLTSKLPTLFDADALNLIAQHPEWSLPQQSVITPHPAEAGRLLYKSAAEIESDRFSNVEELQSHYSAAVVLKGAGTLLSFADSSGCYVCADGNAGMATAGMGDCLSGIIGSLLAQGYTPREASLLGACLHGAAGDRAALSGEVGMITSDLFPAIRQLLNNLPTTADS